MLEVFNGDVMVGDEIQAKRNKLMQDRLKVQFMVMQKMGVSLDNEGFNKWEKNGFAESYARFFAEKSENKSEIDQELLAQEIYEEISKSERPS
jgi:hypothetical protein